MRSLFTFVSLLVVLAIVAVLVRHQLGATSRVVSAPAGAASIPVDAAHASQAVDQYRQTIDQAMQSDAAHTAAQAASADDGTR